MPIITVAKVFIENIEGNILLLRRSATAPRRPLEWDLPGGWVEENEDPQTAAKRELEEEAGVSVRSINRSIFMQDLYKGEKVNRFYYIGIADSSDVVLSYEHDAFKWISKDDFCKFVNYEPHNNAFRQLYA